LKTNNDDKLCITTYIANITLLIGGTIIHSLLGLSIAKNIIINKIILNSWYDVQFMIVNEISMVGCTMFVTMHLKSEKLQ
jgi:hypothetical protein